MKIAHALVALLAAQPCLAHDTWLSPSGNAPGGRVTFELTSSGAFPVAESAVAAERLARSGLRLAGRTSPLTPLAGGEEALRLAATAEGDGSAVAWIETHPRTLTLTPPEVAHYLEEVGAPDELTREWTASGLATWRESYVKLAKTAFRVGSAPADRAWAEPVGLDLEIVPESDPASLRQGDTLSVRLIWKGRPAAGLAVGAASRAHSLPLRTTDAEGRAAFAIDAAGPWLIRCTRIERASQRDADWQSWFATLTFEASAPGR